MKRLLGIVPALLVCSALLQPVRGDPDERSGARVPAPPARLWIAWLNGPAGAGDAAEMARAWDSGAVLLDRFPDALLTSDVASAAALRTAGFRVDGPVLLGAGTTVTLAHCNEP
jgi:hypothetical protein